MKQVVFLLAAGLLTIFSCSVHEYREECPCLLTIDLSPALANTDTDSVFVCMEGGWKRSEAMLYPKEAVSFSFEVPKDFIHLFAASGMKNSFCEGKVVRIPEGAAADSIFAFSKYVETRGEEAFERISLKKQFAVLDIQLQELSGKVSPGLPPPGPGSRNGGRQAGAGGALIGCGGMDMSADAGAGGWVGGRQAGAGGALIGWSEGKVFGAGEALIGCDGGMDMNADAGAGRIEVLVRGNFCGFSTRTLAPLPGPFHFKPRQISENIFRGCIPRQADSGLCIEIKDEQGRVERIPVGEYLTKSGMDWEKDSLDDISIAIDVSERKISISVKDWENGMHKDFYL